MASLDNSARAPRFDIHVHLAGVGTSGSGCWTSAAFRRRPSFRGLRMLYRISRQAMRTSVDQDWAAMVASLVAESRLDYAVVLGFDGVYDAKGRFDDTRSQLVVPPDWVFAVCERYPNLLPGPSINPYRHDAMEALEMVIERGAVLIKWLPIVQGFDPSAGGVRTFLKRLATAGIPLLVHSGTGEVTFATVKPEFGRLQTLLPALEMGVRVICAHGAAPLLLSPERSQVPVLRRLLERFPNLWLDNSGLANPSRFRHLPRFADDPLFRSRTLHGSDFPVITDSIYYLRRLGLTRVREIQAEGNRIERDAMLKEAIGFDEASFTRAGSLLANLPRWCETRP